MMAGVLQCDAGDITVDGQPVWENPQVKERIFFLSDEQYFLPNATPETHEALLRPALSPLFPGAVETLLDSFALDKNRKIRTFSKGMKKQLSVILRPVAQTDYIFCDETFDGLDPVMRQAVKGLFAADVAERELTPIIASHNLRELEDICDHVGLLHKGGILLSRDLDELKLASTSCRPSPAATPREYELRELDILSRESRGSLLSLVVRGQEEEIGRILAGLEPVFFDSSPCRWRDLISETEVAGYDIRKYFSNLLREETRLQGWLTALSSVVFFFALPIPCLFAIQASRERAGVTLNAYLTEPNMALSRCWPGCRSWRRYRPTAISLPLADRFLSRAAPAPGAHFFFRYLAGVIAVLPAFRSIWRWRCCCPCATGTACCWASCCSDWVLPHPLPALLRDGGAGGDAVRQPVHLAVRGGGAQRRAAGAGAGAAVGLRGVPPDVLL